VVRTRKINLCRT